MKEHAEESNKTPESEEGPKELLRSNRKRRCGFQEAVQKVVGVRSQDSYPVQAGSI